MASATQTIGRRRWSPEQRQQNLYGYLFLTPWLIGFPWAISWSRTRIPLSEHDQI